MKNPQRPIALLFLMTITMSCTMLRTVTPPPTVILPTIKPDDNIRVLLENGTLIKEMHVMSIDSISIVGTYPYRSDSKTILIKDIQGIQNLKVGKLHVVKPKSIVQVTLKSGEKIKKLRVTAVDSATITGRDRGVINVSDIATIKMRVPNPGLTWGIVGGLIVGLGLLAIGIGNAFHDI